MGSPSRSAIRTSSGSDPACIFRMTCPRCTFTVISLKVSSAAICLLGRPLTTSDMIRRSRSQLPEPGSR